MFVSESVSRRIALASSAVAVAVACSSAAQGHIRVEIGGGWEAVWDDSMAGLIEVTSLGVVGDAVFIRHSLEFTGQPVNGIVPSVPVVFRPIAPNPVSNVVIEDAIIKNSTGVTWTDFHLDMLSHGNVVFDPAATAASGGGGPIGFSINPFGDATFANNNTRLDITSGLIGSGQVWTPGSSGPPNADDQLWIHIGIVGGEQFVLKGTATIPASGALPLVAMGMLVGSRRRR